VAPDVLLRKLTSLQQVLNDLAPFATYTLEAVRTEHYKLERILELLVQVAPDIRFHILAARGVTPELYCDAFVLAAKAQILPPELAERLQAAAGMHNVIVHMYSNPG
jgi:uncharacterized protein YutE (UPF0331/DUF86 family)